MAQRYLQDLEKSIVISSDYLHTKLIVQDAETGLPLQTDFCKPKNLNTTNSA